jgi:predicted unusual protein kinase regulating ubiquinone biosynthesis (AarF/ABC1/UbiB family)
LLVIEEVLDQAARRAIAETRAVLATGREAPSPAVCAARLGDLIRSNAFLLAEAGLKTQERCCRVANAGVALSRTLVLATVAADIFAGYISLRERARWWPSLVRPQDWDLQHQRGANRALDTAVSLGGALIKAGQFASTRPDLLPEVYIDTLAKVQDRLPPHPWPAMAAVITRELGRRPRDVFAWIDPVPVAAASIAQVHRARLRDGREVAIKIQYPEVANLITTDLAALEKVLAALARLAPTIQLQPIFDFLKATLPLELDFRREAAAMVALRVALRHRTDALVPAVIARFSTERLIVMEAVDGIKITDRVALVNAGISPQAVARLLNDLYAEQILHLGLLHADPHPGNLLVQPGPRLVLLDHGLTVRLAPTLIHELTGMVRALDAGDFDGLKQAMAAAGVPLDDRVEVTTLLQLAGVLFGGERASGIVAVGQRLGGSLGRLPIDLVLVGRALGLLGGITQQLAPDLDVLEIVAGYA